MAKRKIDPKMRDYIKNNRPRFGYCEECGKFLKNVNYCKKHPNPPLIYSCWFILSGALGSGLRDKLLQSKCKRCDLRFKCMTSDLKNRPKYITSSLSHILDTFMGESE